VKKCVGGCGVVFQLTRRADGSWTEKVIHHFTGGADGASPFGSVTLGGPGKLYGTATSGGLPGCGCGVVFSLKHVSGKWVEHVLWSFRNIADAIPTGDLITDSAGNIYGTTNGDFINTFGSVFESAP
jgi:hypothetical protein